jgi:hypothetical protein
MLQRLLISMCFMKYVITETDHGSTVATNRPAHQMDDHGPQDTLM